MSSALHSKTAGKSGTQPNKSLVTKKLIVDEYKTRLKDNIKSLNENLLRILAAAKINTDETTHKNNAAGKMTEYYTIHNEMCTRATLMVKAADELLLLINDIREFLILRDFNFLSNAIKDAEKTMRTEVEQHENAYDTFRHDISGEAEMPEQAAVCHREIGNIYEKLQNLAAERRHLIKAAHLFHKARMVRHDMDISIIQETESSMEECFLRVIERLVKQGSVKLAGMTCIEAADKFMQFGAYERAYSYLIKGSRFVQSDVYFQVSVLSRLCRICYRQQSVEEVLSDLNSIWLLLLKDQPFAHVIREMLSKVECHIILLNLKHVTTSNDSLQKSVLLLYEGAEWKNNLKFSVLTKEQFSTVSKFIESVKSKNYFDASKLQALELDSMLDADGKKIAFELINSLHHRPSADRGFQEILSQECSDLEKRQKMFELYDSLVRKNQSKLENI